MTVLVTGGAGISAATWCCDLLIAGKTWWCSTICPPASGGRYRHRRSLVEGDIGDEALLASVIKDRQIRCDHPFRRLDRRAGIGCRSAGLLSQQHGEVAQPDGSGGRAGVKHFIFSSTAAVYGNPQPMPVDGDAAPNADVALWRIQADDRVDAARHAAAARSCSYVALRYFNVAGADPQGRTGQSTPRATHLIKVACQTLSASASIWIFRTDYERPTAPACATISM